MTKRELIQEYVSGRIDRRSFVARLTGLGVSGAAALAYAQSLTPSASAASLRRDANGYLIRSATTEYGPGDIFKSIIDFLGTLEKEFQSLINLLEALLTNLSASAPSHGVRLLAPIAVGDTLPNGETVTQNEVDLLQTIHNQLKEQAAAIKVEFADFGGASATSSPPKPSASDDLTTLADKLGQLVSLQSAVIPTLGGDSGKTVTLRKTLVTSALVEAEHLAFINQLIGKSPFPSSFAKSANESDINAIISELG